MFDVPVIEQVLPPATTVEEICLRGAAHEFQVDYFVLKAIRHQESGTPGVAIRNRNGTYDLGEMQLNSATISDYKDYGFTVRNVRYNTCENIRIAALHLRTKIAETGDMWKGVAWYHSKTERHGFPYARKVHARYQKLIDAFRQRLQALRQARNES